MSDKTRGIFIIVFGLAVVVVVAFVYFTGSVDNVIVGGELRQTPWPYYAVVAAMAAFGAACTVIGALMVRWDK